MPWGALVGAVVGGGLSMSASRKSNKAMTEANQQSIDEQRRQFELMRSDMSPYRNVGSTALNRLSDLYNLDRKFEGSEPSRGQFTTVNGQKGIGSGIQGDGNYVYLNGNKAGFDPVGSALLGGKKNKGQQAPQVSFDQAGYDAAMSKYQQDLDTFNHRERGASLFEKDPGYDYRLNQGIQNLDRSSNARGIGFSGGAVKELNRYNQDYASNEFTNYANRLSTLAGIGQTATNSSAALGQSNANNISGLMNGLGQGMAGNYMSSYAGANNAIQGGLGNYMFYDYLKKGGQKPQARNDGWGNYGASDYYDSSGGMMI